MAEFKIGDKLLHPLYGAGTVVAIEEQRDNGTVRQYYVIELVRPTGRLLTRVDRAEQMGLRKPISKKDRAKLLRILSGTPTTLPEDYPKRRKKINERLREGSFVEIGQVVRDLAWRKSEGNATMGDRRLLKRAKEVLAEELAASNGVAKEEAMVRIESVIERKVSAWEEDSQ
jgi:CarD family transcriptional regulator